MLQHDFAFQVHPAGDRWKWVVLDEEGRSTANGVSGTPEQAEREARILADTLTRFRRVTKGGW